MKNIITFLAIITFVGLNNLHSQDKPWTLMLYVIGTDIVQDAITDIGEIAQVSNTDSINIIVIAGGSKLEGWDKPTVFTITNGQKDTLTWLPSDTFMVSTTNLTEFINYGTTNYPADKYMMAYYNHGMSIRGWGWDEIYDEQFSISALKTGMENSTFIQNGGKFELLGFDACLMACLEAQVAFKDLGKYYIASEEEEPWHAWHWTPAVTAMNTQVGLDGAALGKIIVDGFIQQAKDENSHGVTLSVVDLAKVSPLETAVENVLKALNDNLYLTNFMIARSRSEEYGKSVSSPEVSEDLSDIGDLFKHMKEIEPGLAPLVDTLLAKLNAAVVYQKSDSARPQAHGISMFVPLNLFTDGTSADSRANTYYWPLPFSDSIKNFIAVDYLDFGFSDSAPVIASLDNSLGRYGSGSERMGMKYAAVKIPDHHLDELHQIQVVLLEEITTIPNEYIVLGSTHHDTSVTNSDGSITYGYEWDEEWLSLNGFPAYIADLQDFTVRDSLGNVSHTFTRIHIPAILNPGTAGEKNIVFDYIYDENFNYELEGIDREAHESGTGFVVTAKDRIHLQPGDKVQLIYEIFDAQTHEATFVPEPGAIIDIQNGNEDLVLGHTQLEAGNYHVGFVIMDHSHNDTLIYDPMVRVAGANGIDVLPTEAYNVSIYPNPSNGLVQIDFIKPFDAKIQVFNSMGQMVIRSEVRKDIGTQIDLGELPTGVYFLKIHVDGKVLQKEILKQ